MSTLVNVYDTTGEVTKQLLIDDDIEYVHGRVHKGKKCYYKGLGVPYTHHYSTSYNDSYEYLGQTDVFYLGDKVKKKAFEGKDGIFQERYQPFFPDFIGSCGIKEGPIVLISEIFERSSVEIFDCIQYDKENDQAYYELDYLCQRKHYVTDDGNPDKLYELLQYMLVNNWNFLWDKGAINDISHDGRVSDLADLFQSKELNHKFGTVYSVLYSLATINKNKYLEFLNRHKLIHQDARSFIFNTIQILKDNNVDVSTLDPDNYTIDNYRRLVLNVLLTGRNCAYCSCNLFKDQGDQVRDQYIERIKQQFR